MVHQQLRKPLIRENRNENDDFMNVQVKQDGSTHPKHPEHLVPEPRTIDTMPDVHSQLRKPLIPENRKDSDDFMNLQMKKNRPASKTLI